MKQIDCIYFQEQDEYLPNMHVCTNSGTLYDKTESMCGLCRLYDAYIPKGTNESLVEYAKKWQNMDYDEQPDYYEYFSNLI